MRYEMLRRIVIENFERGESAVLFAKVCARFAFDEMRSLRRSPVQESPAHRNTF